MWPCVQMAELQKHLLGETQLIAVNELVQCSESSGKNHKAFLILTLNECRLITDQNLSLCLSVGPNLSRRRERKSIMNLCSGIIILKGEGRASLPAAKLICQTGIIQQQLCQSSKAVADDLTFRTQKIRITT